jgi:5-methylcytosine-specific restriction endonuclease McrA
MATVEEIFERDGFRCVYCGFDGSTFNGWAFLQLDHFKPRSRGGTDDPENLVTACVICNQMKGGFYWPNLEEARRNILSWWAQMREYWEKVVEPLVRSK